ncbi:DoxX family membrane protein [Propionibacterium sp.]|uniref:DoxX family membrane protein n=1 Tax=Propionibacterium sp. TaxID=1977903 RepID=UPI0039E807DB
MSKNDHAENLYDSVSTPTDAEEQPAAITGAPAPGHGAAKTEPTAAATKPVGSATESAAPVAEPTATSTRQPAPEEPEVRPEPPKSAPVAPHPEATESLTPVGLDAQDSRSEPRAEAEHAVPEEQPPAFQPVEDEPTMVMDPSPDATQVHNDDDLENGARRAAIPLAADEEDIADYDEAEVEKTQVISEEQLLAEQQEAERRAQEKAERDRRLGTVRADGQAEPAPAPVPMPSTDKFPASIGLFVLRLVTAVMTLTYGYQVLTQRSPVINTISRIGVPEANYVAWGLAGLLFVVSVMILFGLGTRIAGFIIAALGAAMLVFVKWGNFNPFVAGVPGFSGDIDLVLAAVGWTFLFVGAGGWSLDAGSRHARIRRKLEEDA